MRNILFIPQPEDGVYEELSGIFAKEARFEEGFEEAAAAARALCAVPDYPFDLGLLTDRMKYQIVSLPLLWVLLKLQTDIEQTEKYAQELESVLAAVPKAAAYLEACKEKVEGWRRGRWEAQMHWLAAHAIDSAAQLLKLPEIVAERKQLLERIALVEQDNAEKEAQLSQSHKEQNELEKRLTDKEKKAEEAEKKMASREFREEIGQEYTRKVFNEYLRHAKRWGQQRRDKEYDRLEHFLTINLIPQDVKDRIDALQENTEVPEITVGGDYVAGDKRVGNEVNGVAPGATGISLNK